MSFFLFVASRNVPSKLAISSKNPIAYVFPKPSEHISLVLSLSVVVLPPIFAHTQSAVFVDPSNWATQAEALVSPI